jgi:hypothetical protein
VEPKGAKRLIYRPLLCRCLFSLTAQSPQLKVLCRNAFAFEGIDNPPLFNDLHPPLAKNPTKKLSSPPASPKQGNSNKTNEKIVENNRVWSFGQFGKIEL